MQNSTRGFSIHDAFEEETDEAIKVYGSTTVISTPKRTNDIHVCIPDPKGYNKCSDDTTSRDSDSLIQEAVGSVRHKMTHRFWFQHPKVLENWTTVLAAATLLFVGIGLFIAGAFTIVDPESFHQGLVFMAAGFICFIPGSYHIVFIWLAAKGHQGYDFFNLPMFT